MRNNNGRFWPSVESLSTNTSGAGSFKVAAPAPRVGKSASKPSRPNFPRSGVPARNCDVQASGVLSKLNQYALPLSASSQ